MKTPEEIADEAIEHLESHGLALSDISTTELEAVRSSTALAIRRYLFLFQLEVDRRAESAHFRGEYKDDHKSIEKLKVEAMAELLLELSPKPPVCLHGGVFRGEKCPKCGADVV